LTISNGYAPEHLILQVEEARKYAEGVTNAGSVFLGAWTPESVGDYASGTNHVLPTYGFARAYSGLSTESFMKGITFQELSRAGLKELGPVVQRLAEAEQLEAHRNAVTLRLAKA
jgi:histidinol dehydrogenase